MPFDRSFALLVALFYLTLGQMLGVEFWSELFARPVAMISDGYYDRWVDVTWCQLAQLVCTSLACVGIAYATKLGDLRRLLHLFGAMYIPALVCGVLAPILAVMMFGPLFIILRMACPWISLWWVVWVLHQHYDPTDQMPITRRFIATHAIAFVLTCTACYTLGGVLTKVWWPLFIIQWTAPYFIQMIFVAIWVESYERWRQSPAH